MLTPAQIERLAAPRESRRNVVQVITADEAAAAKRRAVAGTKTWRFRAENVRDVAWAAAPDFRWDATSWDGILTQAFYEFPKAGRAVGVGRGADAVVHSHVLGAVDALSVSAGDDRSPARWAGWSIRCS